MSTHIVPGVDVDTVDVTLRIGTAALERFTADQVPCTAVWLTRQPDGTFALGIVTEVPPAELGLQGRAVDTDERGLRFDGPA